jgi:hypothetical protein
VALGHVNVINGRESVMLISAGLVTQTRFLILLTLPKNGTGKCMKAGVRMCASNVERRRELLWDEVQSLAGVYLRVKRSRLDNS